MTWLVTRSIGVVGALLGAVVGGVGSALTLLLVRQLGTGVGARAVVAVPLVALLGSAFGRAAVMGLERDQRYLIRRARAREADAVDYAPIHREGAIAGRAIADLQRALASADLARSDAAEQLEAVVNGLRDGVVIVDEQLSTVSLNRAAADVLDVPRRASIGQALVVVTRDADIVRVVREAVDGRPVQALPIDYRRSGRQLNVQVELVRGRRRTLAVVVLQDVTEIRRLESVRRDFVANVSHELRTPLASIRALAETLEAGAMDDAVVGPDFLRRIVTEVDRMTQLVDGLIDLGRLQAGRMGLHREPTAVEAIVGDAVDRLEPQVAAERLRVQVDVPIGLPPLDVDRVRVDQVLTNLLHNAVKFTPAGGTITVRAWAAGDRVAIEVSDTGVGIGPDEVERVFERFYKSDQSRHSAGTGLGLAIAKHIVLAHGGTIGVASELEVGSTFTVELPVAG